jgi:undecaprenyl-phosphate 4-deoxy-4-formamido-L-arabinose transferase
MSEIEKSVLVSIVIPVYRGAETIGPLVDLLIDALSVQYRLEIVLVNDCSPDNSEEMCSQLYRKHSLVVKFYSLAKNVGEHNAVMAGLNCSKGEWVVIMDDDFQNPVSEVIKLVNHAVANAYDVVYTYYDKKKHSFFRNAGSWFNDRVATIMLNKPAKLYLSSFKVVNRFLVGEIVKYTLPYPYIDGLILRTTSNIGTIKVEHCGRAVGRSGYTMRKLVSLWMNMFTNFSIIPLRISMGIGFAFAAIGFFIGIEIIVEKITNPSLPVGYALLVFLITVFAATQLIAIGMVGEYLGRMFLYQNKKPQFSIRKAYDTPLKSEPDGKK